jgi:carbon starvation protein
MITEAFLATVVIIAVSAGIGIAYESSSGVLLTGRSAWDAHYGSWAASSGLGSKLTAVVVGCANMMSTLGISTQVGISIMGVFIASFAGTTLDSATRVQRYILSEFISLTPLKGKLNKYAITAIVVLSAAMLAFSSGADGKGALLLWPLFGAVNQLLGGLALLVGTIYLQKSGGLKWMVTAIPCLFLMITSIWASIINQITFLQNGQSLLFLINGIIIGVSVLMSLEIGAIGLRWRQTPSRSNQDVSRMSG